MRVQVRLFATLARHAADHGGVLELELPEGSTIGDLVSLLKLPPEELKVTFVNGRRRPLDYPLHVGDRVGMFPPIGGG